MSVSIKVAVRCRPFTIDDKLGVTLTQVGEEEGEINVINSTYSTTRFAFTCTWWSAFGFSRHIQSNHDEAATMELVDQDKVYLSVGRKIKADLLSGNAVVLFAYGLSGSGKTFTVFGPDAVDEPEAWFKHSKPHPLWGIFPRLAYELFNEKEDGWKITMKYFQNVVDIVRDLMSPLGKEMHYKNGMKKDPDGFTDIEWCSSAVLNSWDDLRTVFRAANARKAIAPTQFNHQSTRGHCIMTLEVEMPHPDMPGMKQKGRVYVCDLAGTEPAGDIVFARYDKKVFDGGDIEYKYLGPHQDIRKTKELQDQGKKINLSLSEMAQFFMKMAEAVQQGTLKPGLSIPGCNSYFLCKYLKDTMLQARTYLFCAIRPEVTYHRYTFSTLGFAKNASVVKLKPKMTTVQATPAERKLMAELEQMKALVEQLQRQQIELAPTVTPIVVTEAEKAEDSQEAVGTVPAEEPGEDPVNKRDEGQLEGAREEGREEQEVSSRVKEVEAAAEAAERGKNEANEELRKRRASMVQNAEQVSRLQEMLEAKQMQLREVLSGGGGGQKGPTPEERQLEQQREEYGRRGISLAHFEADTRRPHFINVDEDPFRHNRFIYVLRKSLTVFGPRCDVQPMSLSVQRKHCSVEVKKMSEGVPGSVTLIGGRGDVFHNGRRLRKQEKVVLAPYDRVVMGAELLLFRWKALVSADTPPPPSAEEAVMEFKEALQARSGRRRSVELHTMEQQLKDLQAEKAKAEAAAKLAAAERVDKGEGKEEQQTKIAVPYSLPGSLDDERVAKLIRSAEDEVHMILPKVKEAEHIMQLFGREHLTFDVGLQRTQGEENFEVAASVQVKNNRTGQSSYVSSFEFLEHHSIFNDEVAQLRAALDNEREYDVPPEHDPSLLLLERTHQLGISTLFTEPIVYMMATEKEERLTVIKNIRAPYDEVGTLEAAWYPLALDAEGRTVDPEVNDNCDVELPDIDTPKDLIGLPWAYRFEIKAASGLPLTCGSAYCQYDLLGETFTSETVQPDPPSAFPEFNYSFVHRVDKVTQEVVDQLSQPLNVCLYVGAYVEPEKPEDAIGTKHPAVRGRFEAFTRPNTPVPTTPASGANSSRRNADMLTSHENEKGGDSSPSQQEPSGGDPDANQNFSPSSWGFAAPAILSQAGINVPQEEGISSATGPEGELDLLRAENSSLKKELKEARALIARLMGREGGGGGDAAQVGTGGGSRIAVSSSDGALRSSGHGCGGDGHECEGRNGETDSLSLSPRSREKRGQGPMFEKERQEECGERRSRGQEESRGVVRSSRKKAELDTAKATDAAVEAGVVGVSCVLENADVG